MKKAGILSRLMRGLPNFTLMHINGVPSGKNGLKKVEMANWKNNENSGKNKTIDDYIKGVNIERTKTANYIQIPREKRPKGLDERA